MTRVVHFLLHVPKCAGTTVENHFRAHLGDGYIFAPRWDSPLRNFIGNRYPGLRPADLEHVRAVSGHSLSTGMRALFPGCEGAPVGSAARPDRVPAQLLQLSLDPL